MARARSLVPLRTTPGLPTEPAPPPAPPGTVNPPEWPDTRHVSRDYLDVMGIDVVAGRRFDEGDAAGRQVLLINETLERSGLLGPNPVGRQVYALGILPWEVVGVIEDVHQSGLDHEPGPQVFMDLRQLPDAAVITGAMYFVVRAGEDNPASLIPAIRRIVRDLDTGAAVQHVATMDRLLAESTARPRLYAVLLAMFSALAISLAAVGIYGVVAYAATRRTREIGIRIALGARRAEVMRLMLGQSAAFIVLGVVLGLAGSAAVMPSLAGIAVRPRTARRPDVRVGLDRPGRHRRAGILSAGPPRRAGGSVDRDSLRIGFRTYDTPRARRTPGSLPAPTSTLLRGVQRQVDGDRDALPVARLGFQLMPAVRRQLVELRLPVGLRAPPLGRQPALLREAVQGRKERAGVDAECTLRDLLHPPRDPEAVVRPRRERTKNQQVEGAAHEVGPGHRRVSWHPYRISTRLTAGPIECQWIPKVSMQPVAARLKRVYRLPCRR